MNEPLITSREVGRRLGMAQGTVNAMARNGTLPCVRISKRVVRFSWQAVKEAVGYQEQASCGACDGGVSTSSV